MKLQGKLTTLDTKDYGKGKDAAAQEKGIVRFKLDGQGYKGTLILEHEMDDAEFSDLRRGDTINVNVDLGQQKMDLNNRARDRREVAASKAH